MNAITYKTRDEAKAAIREASREVYHLGHGEYSAPDYEPRKVRGEDAYYVHATHYFYEGTINTPKDGPTSL